MNDLFDVANQTAGKEVKDKLLEELEHYGIDKIYRDELKGKELLLYEILDRLMVDIENYKSYKKDLIKRLEELLPKTEEFIKTNSLKTYQGNVFGWQTKRMSSPIFCLEMIDEELFSEVKLKRRNNNEV